MANKSKIINLKIAFLIWINIAYRSNHSQNDLITLYLLLPSNSELIASASSKNIKKSLLFGLFDAMRNELRRSLVVDGLLVKNTAYALQNGLT